MRVAVTGSSGFIGGALVAHLRAAGHDVRTLVRRPPVAAGEVRWDPMAGTLDRAALAGTEAAVHLAGAGVGDRRWTRAYKQEILRSRTEGTRTLVTALGALDPPPRVLVCASAIGVLADPAEEGARRPTASRPRPVPPPPPPPGRAAATRPRRYRRPQPGGRAWARWC